MGCLNLRSIVQCPHCHFKVTERMSTTQQVREWECPACHKRVQASPGACCIFCEYGTVPCPAVQQGRGAR